MRTALSLTLALLAFVSASAITIEDNVSDCLGQPYPLSSVTLQPLSFPSVGPAKLYLPGTRGTGVTNGAFKLQGVVGGYYDLQFEDVATIRIVAPPNDTNTYTVAQLAFLATNLVSFELNTNLNVFTYTYRATNTPWPITWHVRAGDNVIITTNNPGAFSEYVTISTTGDGSGGITLSQATAAAAAVVETNTTAVTASLQAEIYNASNSAYSLAVAVAKTNAGQRIYNVQSYGAVGDGVTDDTAALAAAWTAWTNAPRGGVLYFPSGSYRDLGRHRINVKLNPGNPGNPEPQWIIRADGSGGTQWISLSEEDGDFIQVSQIPIKLEGITFVNGAENKRGKNGVMVVGNSGTHILDDAAFVDYVIGFDGNGGAGGKVYSSSVLRCGTGLRVSGYCDGWTVTMSARKCWRAGVEIGGTNQLGETDRANGSRITLTGTGNNIGVLLTRGVNAEIFSYAEETTNGVVVVGAVDGSTPDNVIWGLKISGSGVQLAGTPGIILNTRVRSMVIDGCSGIAGTGRYDIESTSSRGDSSSFKTENNNQIFFKKSTGQVVHLAGKNAHWNWFTHFVGDSADTPYTIILSDNTSTNASKSFRIGQYPWDGDWLHPQVPFVGRIWSATRATISYGGSSGPTGKPYTEHLFYAGNPSAAENGSNVFSILPAGVYGSGIGLTNIPLTGVSGLSNALTWLTNNTAGGGTGAGQTGVVTLVNGQTGIVTLDASAVGAEPALGFAPQYGTANGTNWSVISTNIITDLRQEIADTTLDFVPQHGSANLTNLSAYGVNAFLTWTNISTDGGDTVRMQPILAGTVWNGSLDYTDAAGEWRFNQGLRVPYLVLSSNLVADTRISPNGSGLMITNPATEAFLEFADGDVTINGEFFAQGGIPATNLSGTIDPARLPAATTNAIWGGINLSNPAVNAIYMLSITTNTTLGAFGNLHASEFRTAQLWVQNTAGSNCTVALPDGTSCPDGNPLYVTNGQRRVVSIGGLINFTNAISRALP